MTVRDCVRWLRPRRALALAVCGPLLASCWGDEVPSLDRVGVVGNGAEGMSILFGSCPGEGVERVRLELTDDHFEETEHVLWEIESVDRPSQAEEFTVGRSHEGFREVTAMGEPVQPDDHLHLVVTTTEVGTVPMSFVARDLRSDEVLVRDEYRSPEGFETRAAARCPGDR